MWCRDSHQKVPKAPGNKDSLLHQFCSISVSHHQTTLHKTLRQKKSETSVIKIKENRKHTQDF